MVIYHGNIVVIDSDFDPKGSYISQGDKIGSHFTCQTGSETGKGSSFNAFEYNLSKKMIFFKMGDLMLIVSN